MRFSAIHNVLLVCLCCFPLVIQAQSTRDFQVVDSLLLHFKWRTADSLLDRVMATELTDVEQSRAALYKANALERTDELDKATAYALDALEKATEIGLPDVQAEAHIILSLIQERIGEVKKSSAQLDKAEQLIFMNKLEPLYAQYYVRRSSLMRVDSENPDSLAISLELAIKANQYAEKHKQPRHLADSHLLISALTYKTDLKTSMAHRHAAIRIFMREGDYISAGYMYSGMAKIYGSQDSMELAFAYFDTAARVHLLEKRLPAGFYGMKAELFQKVGQYDSAFAYMNRQQIAFQVDMEEQKRVEVAELHAISEAEKKQADLESQLELNERQKRLLVQATAFSIIVLIVLVILFVLYRKLKASNERINQQAKALETSLHKQQVLLAEVQHRVKNNLQVIIGLLDLQKDAPAGKTIEEITNESQKRIESMAFLHDKIYLSNELDKVNLQSYLDDIAKLMESSYSTMDFPVRIEVSSDISSLSIDKAIPLGLITVELLINSFKHAFWEGQEAHIQIFTKVLNEGSYSSKFIYTDNGKGFEGELKGNGLGMEIIRGLVGQLHGKVSFEGSKGYEATILF